MPRKMWARLVFGVWVVASTALFCKIMQVRGDNRQLADEVDAISKTNATDENYSDASNIAAEIETLAYENKDLFKLRNEITQLRRQKAEADKLRSENAALAEKNKSSALSNHHAPLPASFIMRDSLIDSGFASPEATLQTFFHALVTENYRKYNECIGVSANDEEASEESAEAYRFRELSRTWKNFPGYFITGTQFHSPDKVTLNIKSSVNGSTLPLELQNNDGRWRMIR